MRVVVAQKDHWCILCNRKIPEGHRYWQHTYDKHDWASVNKKEHTNCLEYEHEPTKDEECKGAKKL